MHALSPKQVHKFAGSHRGSETTSCNRAPTFLQPLYCLKAGSCAQQIQERLAKLEAELRAAKRREEKLAALHFRLREDAKAARLDPT